jgi:acetoin utilization deacetylase AcuC-like enzyme
MEAGGIFRRYFCGVSVVGSGMRCFYSSDLELELPPGHRFPMDKFRIAKDMLVEGGVLRGEEIVEVRAADAHVLKRVHDPAYLQKIYSGKLDRKEQILLGLPVTTKLYTRSAIEAEATRLACHAALEEGVAVCLAGGMHHAFRGHGEGYCVFNDVAIAVLDLKMKRPGIKVMVVDTAAHQGNGTNAILENDPDIFTYSIHVGPKVASKVSGSMDVETVRYVEGEMYLGQLFASLAAALEVFAPDLVIWVSGADNHRNDHFGEMFLSLKDMQTRDEVLLGALLRNRIPVAVLYGGGSNRQPEFTAKIHRNTVATAKRLAGIYRGL